ncbi:MAG TPA: hypothetical protein VGD42_11905 [Lysobacter sp.]
MTTAIATRPITFWIVAVLALLWNLLGVAMFCMQLAITPEQLATMPPEQRQIHEAMPGWVQVAYAVAVFGGVLGAIGLLLKKRWAIMFFVLSLAGLVAQCLGTFLLTPAWQAMGPSGLALPILLLVIAWLLVAYSRRAAAHGWLS